MYNLIIENKEIAKLIYGFIVSFICLFIVLKSDKLFRLSNHNGIRYFRNAFFFYGIAFVIRYFVGTSLLESIVVLRWGLTKFFFEFFMILAGFFLLYSLLWKRLEYKKNYSSSLFNLNILIFYLMAFIIAFIDLIWGCYSTLFISQIILFFILFLISYFKYVEQKNDKSFLRFYSLAMVLSLIAWILNALASLIFHWNYGILIAVYCLNIVIFLLFLYGVIKINN